MPTALEFLENHGKNILLSNGNRTATRVASYNQGIVVVSQPLVPQLLVQVGLTSLSPAPLAQGDPGPTLLQRGFSRLRTKWKACPLGELPGLLFISCGGSCISVSRKYPAGGCDEGSSGEGLRDARETPDSICGNRACFPEEGVLCCRLQVVGVRQVKKAHGDKNPFRSNSKTKAERGKDTAEFAVSCPSRHRKGWHPRPHCGVLG